MTDIALVRTLDERLFNAWPALQTVYLDGWMLRMAGGHTKRSNAASPFYPSSISGEELIRTVKTLYRKAGIEPMVRITPLAGEAIDPAFAAAGRLDDCCGNGYEQDAPGGHPDLRTDARAEMGHRHGRLRFKRGNFRHLCHRSGD